MVKNKNILLMAAMLLSGSGMATAQQADSTYTGEPVMPMDTVKTDTIIYQEPTLITTKIKLLTRTYGDSIALRWVPEDYVSWKYLCLTGVNVLRTETDADDFAIDTLAYGLKPLTEEQFRAKYAQTDSNALVAQGVLYGEGRLGPNQTQDQPGSWGASMEYNNEQDMSFAFAMLVAEWRPDLARDMAVGFLDRTAKPGKTYDYYIQPTKWETDGRLIFEPGVAEGVENKPYEPAIFNPRMTDSISSPRRHVLGWWDDKHSTYEIYRRFVTDADGNKIDGTWEHLNRKPYLSVIDLPEGDNYKAFGDSVPSFGVYEYMIAGHDAFGGLVPSINPIRVNVYDNEPPTAPQLKAIVIGYPDDDIRGRIQAHIIWEKDTLEKDLQGYVVRYYNARISGETWIELNEEMIPPTDTMYVAEVTGLRTGMIQVAAYDKSGNESTSLSQLIEIHDYKAPAAPDSLWAQVTQPELNSIVGKDVKYAYVILHWRPNPEDDDIMHYDVAFANDSTHPFLTKAQVRVPMYADTLVLDVNQKYIYYRVRAVDYSNNFGEWCPWIRVARPHVTPPTQPHLDASSHTDEKGMHMEWVVGTDADMLYHLAYRRCGDNGPWELIGRYDADSLRQTNYTIVIDDDPAYDTRQRYYYMVESFNSSPYSSQSLAVSWLHRGPHVVDVELTAQGAWVSHEQLARLTWTRSDLPDRLRQTRHYYCVFRKGPKDKRFRYQYNVEETEYVDRQLRPGETAEYYVVLRFDDGRESQPSNVVTITRDK